MPRLSAWISTRCASDRVHRPERRERQPDSATFRATCIIRSRTTPIACLRGINVLENIDEASLSGWQTHRCSRFLSRHCADLLLVGCRGFPYFIFQRFDFPIPDHEPVFNLRFANACKRLQQAYQQSHEGQQDQQTPFDKAGQPEWKVALQEGMAAIQVARAFVRDGKFFGVQVGKRTERREVIFSAVDGLCRLQQQVSESGVQGVLGYKQSRGGEKGDGSAEVVDDAGRRTWKNDLGKRREFSPGLGLGETHQLKIAVQ